MIKVNYPFKIWPLRSCIAEANFLCF